MVRQAGSDFCVKFRLGRAPMRLKIACAICRCRYAVIGSAFFGPACGDSAADTVFAPALSFGRNFQIQRDRPLV